MVNLLDVHCNSGFKMLVKFWNGFFQTHRFWSEVTIKVSYFITWMKRWKSDVPVRWLPCPISTVSRLSWAVARGPFIAGSSKNLIFALWMDPNGFGKKPLVTGVCEFDGVLSKMLFISPDRVKILIENVDNLVQCQSKGWICFNAAVCILYAYHQASWQVWIRQPIYEHSNHKPQTWQPWPACCSC